MMSSMGSTSRRCATCQCKHLFNMLAGFGQPKKPLPLVYTRVYPTGGLMVELQTKISAVGASVFCIERPPSNSRPHMHTHFRCGAMRLWGHGYAHINRSPEINIPRTDGGSIHSLVYCFDLCGTVEVILKPALNKYFWPKRLDSYDPNSQNI